MIDDRIIIYCRDLLKNDPTVLSEMDGTVRVYLDRVDTETELPCLMHGVQVTNRNDPVFFGNYYIDVFDAGYDSDRIRTVANRIVALLNNRVVRDGGGGLRFFFRDKYSSVVNRDKAVRVVCLMFAFRGSDVDLHQAQQNI